MSALEHDVIVVGSGFGGAVAAALSTCRLRDGTMADATTGQKVVDGFWASSANSRHATNRAASCLR